MVAGIPRLCGFRKSSTSLNRYESPSELLTNEFASMVDICDLFLITSRRSASGSRCSSHHLRRILMISSSLGNVLKTPSVIDIDSSGDFSAMNAMRGLPSCRNAICKMGVSAVALRTFINDLTRRSLTSELT